MRVLTLGWEFPPFFAGGVGIVCYELTKALSKRGVDITYVMPFGPEHAQADHVKLLVASRLSTFKNLKLHFVNSTLQGYETAESYDERMHTLTNIIGNEKDSGKALYGANLFEEIHKYSLRIRALAMQEEFDIIHAHDWTTFPAAVGAKHVSGKPLIVHVHITQFDMVGGEGNINQMAYDIERYGMHEADTVVCVSEYVKQRVMRSYGVPEHKIRVLHNAAGEMKGLQPDSVRIKAKDKIVLFVGRVTLQKGPDYFVRAARMVVDKDPNVKFVMAGTGDMLNRMIEMSAGMGMADKFIFTGFCNREQVEKLFAMADCFVMPSVSEPFGIVPLEAMQKNTPVIVSRQSGVSEVLRNALKVDFWDVQDMANKILAVLKYRALSDHLTEHGAMEVGGMTWDKYAERLEQVYDELMPRLMH
jgi:glycosyltransferase involved in cell wall biosynthesis